jgi:hypothetical protein
MQPLTSDDPAAIGGYRLRGRLGAGGMGRVYLASTPAGRAVALKVVHPELGDDQEFRARFRQEIQAARRVHGLYTAQLLDADPAATPPWLVTAYVPGPSLQQAVAESGPMPEVMVFRMIAGVAEALQAIHAAGLVHRELKPSNVLLAPDGPRVIDFGIARALEATSLTRTGMMVGSPQFMAPEQILDQPVTPAIDVFALGSLAAYAVLCRAPFGEGPTAAVSYRVLHRPPDLDGCPPQLRILIERCLSKEAAARPGPGQIVDFCLARAAGTGGPGQAAPVLAAPAAPPPPRGVAAAAGQPARTPGEVLASNAAWAPVPPGTTARAPQYPPAAPAAGRPVPPRSMVNAVRLMYAGGLLAAAGLIAAVAKASALRAAIRQQYPAAAHGLLGATTGGALGLTVISGLIATIVWLAMARRTRRGRPGVRIWSTALFGIDTLSLIHSWAGGVLTHPAWFFGLAEWGAGLAAIVFLWSRQSSSYFAQLRQARSLATPQWRPAR